MLMKARILAFGLLLAGVSLAGAIGYAYSPVTVIAKTATGAIGGNECVGTVITNAGAGGAIILTLPIAAAGLYCTFSTVNAQQVTVNPNGSQQLMQANIATLAAGDAVQSAASAGSSLTVVAVDSTNWVITSQTGTWTDVN